MTDHSGPLMKKSVVLPSMTISPFAKQKGHEPPLPEDRDRISLDPIQYQLLCPDGITVRPGSSSPIFRHPKRIFHKALYSAARLYYNAVNRKSLQFDRLVCHAYAANRGS